MEKTSPGLVEIKNYDELKRIITNSQPADIAEAIHNLNEADQVNIFRIIPIKQAVSVFEFLDFDIKKELINKLDHEQAAYILNEMSPDDRTAFLEYLSPKILKPLLLLLSDEERKVTLTLLGYPDESVGRLMTPDYITVNPEWNIEQTLEHIRNNVRHSETLDAIYVVNENGVLIDDLKIRDILFQQLNIKIRDIMDIRYESLHANQDQEEAVKLFWKYHRTALPVIDEKSKVLLGIVTIDDILQVLKKEDTEDIQKLGGVEALDEPYLQISPLKMIKKRAGWLVILFLSEMLTATAMGFFEDEISKAVVLALFVPLIISSGGNSGSQATTLIIRAMALGEVRLRDWWRVMRREFRSGFFLGLILGVIGFFRIMIWTFFSNIYGPHWILIALTVGCSLVGIVLWGSLSGSMLPFILKKAGLDPATASAPFVATLVDVTGLIIYFTVALLFLKGTLL
jgi:magnesium transporter